MIWMDRRWCTVVALFVGTSAISLLLYTQTVNPGVYWGDTAEFQRVASTLDLPHPTGYPLYILLGHFWIRIWPFGSVALKMNLLSGVFAALAVGVVSVLIYRVTRCAVAAAFGGLMLAVSSSFWSQAVIAEVYALHTLLVSGILLTLLWSRPPRPSSLPFTALLVGLGLTHHRMAILLLPGIAAYIVCEKSYRGLSGRWVAAILVALGLGLSPLLLTYLQRDWPTFRAFLEYVLHSGGQWFSFQGLPEYFGAIIWPLLRQQMGILGLLLGTVGLVYSYRQIRPRSCGTIMLFGISGLLAVLFLIAYRVGDIFAFFGHFQVIHATLMGFGLAGVLGWLRRLRPFADKPWLLEALVWILIAIPLLLIGASSWKANDLTQERYIEERSLAVLDHVESSGLLVTGWPGGQPLMYHQEVEGFRKDLRIMVDDTPAAAKVHEYMSSGSPVYFWSDRWIDLIDQTTFRIVFAEHEPDRRDLYRVVPKDSLPSGTPFRKAIGQAITADLVLDSYRIRPWSLEADGIAELTLCWSGHTELVRDRILVFRVDTEHDWLSHEFEVGDRLDASGCSIQYLILPPAPFVESARGEIRVHQRDRPEPEAEIELEAVAIIPGHDVSDERLMLKGTPSPELSIDGAELLGGSNDATTSPGISFPIDVYWRLSVGGKQGPAVQLELRDKAGNTVDHQVWSLPTASLSGERPISGIYAARYWLDVARRAEPGIYTIHLGAIGRSEMTQVSAIEVEEPERIWRQPSIETPVTYEFAEGRILLEGFELTASAQAIDLTLYWKCVMPVDENWKVFIHVTDQGGNIVAQNDSFPGDGLRWTDTWKPKEHIIDQHALALPMQGDGSDLTILVGMYNPETGGRVPIRTGLDGDSVVDSVRLTTISR